MENYRFAFWGLEATYDVHLRLIGISINRTGLLGATDESLPANMDWKSVISLQWRQLDPKFQVEGVAIVFLRKLR